MSDLDEARPLIGLEVHIQIGTVSKLFCRCPALFGATPNSLICPICSGQPGSLPVTNGEALRRALIAALALQARPAEQLIFDRKHYSHPDLPKGYQITQVDEPLARDGQLAVPGPDGQLRIVRIQQLHLEEDAGRLLHPAGRDTSWVDLNRAGRALLEVVTGPDLRSAGEAVAFLQTLRSLLRYVGVGDCDMEKGQFRCDVNLSLRRRGSDAPGIPTETKNLNSFGAVRTAIEAECVRQSALLESGLEVQRQTMGLDVESGRTTPLRSKESVGDYRVLREPDLPAVELDPRWIEELAQALPEPVDQRHGRYVGEHGLSEREAAALLGERSLADAFDALLEHGVRAHTAVTWILGEWLHMAHSRSRSPDQPTLDPPRLAELLCLLDQGQLGRGAARQVAVALEDDATAGARETAERLDLLQVSDTATLTGLVDAVLEAEPDLARRYAGGEPALLHALVGAVMQASQGRARPQTVQRLLRERLAPPGS